MTTRKKREISDLEGLEQSSTDETVELNTTCPSVEDHSEVLVDTLVEEAEVIEQKPVETRPRPPAPAKRKPSRNTPKFSSKFR